MQKKKNFQEQDEKANAKINTKNIHHTKSKKKNPKKKVLKNQTKSTEKQNLGAGVAAEMLNAACEPVEFSPLPLADRD